MDFAKFLRTSFDRTPLDDCFLCLSENFEKFFRTPLLQRTAGEIIIFHVQVTDFLPPGTVKNYFTGAFFKSFLQERQGHGVKVGLGPRDPPQSLKVEPEDPFQNLKVGSQDSLQSLKVGPPHLSLMNSFFSEYIKVFFLLIYFCVFFKKETKNINCE